MNQSDPVAQLKKHARHLESTFSDEAPEAAARALAGSTRPRGPATSRVLSRAAAIVLAVGVGLGSLSVAADAAVPGQLLYPVDRSVERVLGLLGLSSPEQRLGERTLEARTLLDADKPVAAMETLLDAVLVEFDQLSPETAAEHVTPILQTLDRAENSTDSPPEESILGVAIKRIRGSVGSGEGTIVKPDSSEDQKGLLDIVEPDE